MKALVLGGGGARGAAHIGVLQALSENNYEFDIVTGTSAGSLVGGFYAAGFTPTEIAKISSEINWEIFNIRWFSLLINILKSVLFIKHEPYITTDSLINTKRFEKILKKHLGNTDFNKLKYDFATPAVDLHTGEVVTFCKEGSLSRETPLLTDKKLWQAMRSSMALPVAFSPMEFAPWLLTDGGVKENLPVDLAAELGATSALVVDVSPPMPPLKHDNFMHIGLRALDIIGQESNDWTTKIKVDIIQPNVAKINTLDFNKLDEAIAAGYKAGYDYLKQHDMSKKG